MSYNILGRILTKLDEPVVDDARSFKRVFGEEFKFKVLFLEKVESMNILVSLMNVLIQS